MKTAIVPVPAFPFFNRDEELAELIAFCSPSEGTHKIAILEGDPGIGKSALLSQLISSVSEYSTIISISGREATHADISMSKQIANKLHEQGRRSKALTINAGHWKKRAFNLTKKLAASSPILGPFIEEIFDQVANLREAGESESSRPKFVTRALASIEDAILICDDIQWLNEANNAYLADLIPLASGEKNNLKIILALRELESSRDTPLGSTVINLAGEGRLLHIKLHPLATSHMRQIAANIFGEPLSAASLIEVANGNPERLRQSILWLNLRGRLRLRDGLLHLSDIERDLPQVTAINWLSIMGEPRARRLLGVLAVGPKNIPSALLLNILTREEGLTKGQAIDLFERLKHEGIIFEAISANSPEASQLFLSHDTLRQQIREQLQSGSRQEYIYCNELLASGIYQELEIASPGLIAKLMALSNLEVEVPSEAFSFHATLVQLAISLREAVKANWPSFSIAVIRICDEQNSFAELITVGEPTFEWAREIYDSSSPLVGKIATSLMKAYYNLGRYDSCSEVHRRIMAFPEPLYQFYLASSLHMLNRNRESFGLASKLRKEIGLSDELAPMLTVQMAISLRECGDYEDGDALYRDFLPIYEQNFKKTSQGNKFAFMSPHFLEVRESLELCQSAVDFFADKNDLFLLAMALNNMGCTFFWGNDGRSALRCFERSRDIFVDMASHEAVYPLNNLAAIALLTGEYEKASRSLEICLFYRLARYSEFVIRMNTALASLMVGRPNPIRQFGKIRDIVKMMNDPWVETLATYNEAFVEIKSNEPVDQSLLDRHYAALTSCPLGSSFAHLWNNLAREIASKNSLKLRLIEVSRHASSPEARISESLRPGILCFAH